MKNLFIKDAQAGDKLNNEPFAVKSVRKGKTKDGKDFVDVNLSDKTGQVMGKIWEDNLNSCDQFEAGDIVVISGSFGEFREKLQINITFLQKTEDFDLVDFLPHTEKDIDELWKLTQSFVSKIKEPNLKALVDYFFSDKDFVEKFKKAPAAETIHHAYVGGFLEHTTEMLKAGEVLISDFPRLNADLLYTGVLLHDIGKLEELAMNHAVYRTISGALIGHLCLGAMTVSSVINELKNFPEDLRNKILHLIVSHHGKLEYGSPIVPMTREAVALNHLDDMSTKVNVADQTIIKNQDNGQDFSDRHFALETRLYLK